MNDEFFSRVLARYRQMKRHATARNALDVLAVIFLVASFAFWAVAFWQLIQPPSVISLPVVPVVALALVFSLAAPVLWTALIPTTPAGQLLQKTQTRTAGFAVTVAAAVYLSYTAFRLIERWLASQPAVAENGMVKELAIGMAIAFILVPALAWTQVAPERWLAQIEQAHQVKKLEALQAGELAIIKTRLLWAKQKAAASYANLLPLEQREIHETLRGLFLSIGDSQRAIAGTLRDSVGFDREFAPLKDEQVYQALDYVADTLERKRIDVPAYAGPDEDVVALAPRPVAAAEPAPPRPVEPPPRPAAPRRAPPRYAAELDQARGALDGMWSAKQLGDALGKSERTARDWLAAWEESGAIARGETKGNFYFTEARG